MTKKAVVKQDPELPVETEILEQSIVDVAAAAKKLLAGRLSSRAIQILIRDASGNKIGLETIGAVLECAASLEERYLKRPSRPEPTSVPGPGVRR